MSELTLGPNEVRDRLARAYEVGSLDGAMRLMVETQASMRPDSDVALAGAVGAAMFEDEIPAALAPDAWMNLVARLVDASPPAHAPGASRRRFSGELAKLPEPLRSAALETLGERNWKFGGPGVRILPLALPDSTIAELIRIEPGFGVPNHTHDAGEYTLVLSGAFHDERGRYGVGDIAFADPSVTHTPVAELGEVCFNLAISEAPLRLTGAMGLVQRLWLH